MSLDLGPIRERLGALRSLTHVPHDIARLLDEVDELRARLREADELKIRLIAASERIHDLEQTPLYSLRAKVERIAPTAAPNGATVGFSWKVRWIIDELVRVRAELEQLRTNPATNTGDKP